MKNLCKFFGRMIAVFVKKFAVAGVESVIENQNELANAVMGAAEIRVPKDYRIDFDIGEIQADDGLGFGVQSITVTFEY